VDATANSGETIEDVLSAAELEELRRSSREQMLQKLDLCKNCKGDCDATIEGVEVHLQ
jgi:hypothetical protein